MRNHLARLIVAVVLLAGTDGCNDLADSGRIAAVSVPTKPTSGFTLVLLPDTQCYPSLGASYSPGSCGGTPDGNMDMMFAQMKWIVAHRQEFKIAAVVGLGDIVNDAHRANEWQAADSAYQMLDNADIPYVATIGNHDYDTTGGSLATRKTSQYNLHFGVNRFTGRSWRGSSSYPEGGNENSYITFDVGAHRFLVLSLELFPRDAALQWAADIIAANPGRQVIVATHAYLGPKQSRTSSDPMGYEIQDGNNGEGVWNRLISKYPNIIAVVNGHDAPSEQGGIGATRRVDKGEGGNLVVQMFSNYQFSQGGGSGYMRLLNVRPERSAITVQSFSPYLGKLIADSENSYTEAYGTAH